MTRQQKREQVRKLAKQIKAMQAAGLLIKPPAKPKSFGARIKERLFGKAE